MREPCCAAHAFSGCCEGIECRTASRRKEERQKLARLIAKRNAATFQMMVSVAVCFGLFAFSFIHFAVPDAKRQALRNQENVHVVSR